MGRRHETLFPPYLLAVVLLGGPGRAQSSQDAVARSCVGSDAGTPDPEARETICLRELRERARRTGNILSLKLENGTTKLFRSNPESCKKDDAKNCVEYRLIGFHTSAGRYLVNVTYYENFECKLVSVRTGKATTFRNVPHFAPDGSTFFVTGYDGSYDNWLGIGSVASDPPALVWEKDPVFGESWEFLRWIDNDQVALVNTTKSEICPNGNCEAILKRKGAAWALERLPRKSGARACADLGRSCQRSALTGDEATIADARNIRFWHVASSPRHCITVAIGNDRH